MQLGMIGLGRMGANLVRRAMRDGHECVVYDPNSDAVKALVGEGAKGVDSIPDLVRKLKAPRAAWVMVPAGAAADSVITELANWLEAGDTVIDGCNSYYRDDIRHAKRLADEGVHLLDCGTSGGVWGLERGYSLMIGGDPDAFAQVEPIFA
jgi:6-phosphogluconate dehydrogenase